MNISFIYFHSFILTNLLLFFESFFAFYHGLRKTLQVYVPQPVEENIAIAAGISLIPVGTMKQLRPLFPYGILLVVLDAFNEMTDKYK